MPSQRPFQAPDHGEPEIREALEAHLVRHLGDYDELWHEILSELVHIDVYMWRPSPERSMYTFVTIGMSAIPMAVPRLARWTGSNVRAELVVCLPPDWQVPKDPHTTLPWDDADAYFPLYGLKQIARLPHEYHSWLGAGHTINDDPPEPLAATTELCGWVLLPPTTLPESFRPVELSDGTQIDLFGIVALHRDEIDRKVIRGIKSLLPGLEQHHVNELLDVDRASSLRF